MTDLFGLYEGHRGKVSDKWSFYINEYQKIFADFIVKPISILEIGVQNGGSLEIWADYFKFADHIIGCDINPACLDLKFQSPRIQLIIGDANLQSVKDHITAITSTFDIIIDDGSHISSDIIDSFNSYFPIIKENGVYIVEDLHCSYWNNFNGGLYHTNSSIAFFKKLADIVNYEHWGLKLTRLEFLKQSFPDLNINIKEGDLEQIHSIEFLNSICVIKKAPSNLNELGVRVFSGDIDIVVPTPTHLRNSRSATPDQSKNIWSLSSSSIQSYVAERETQVKDLEAQLGASLTVNKTLTNYVAERETQVKDLDGRVDSLSRIISTIYGKKLIYFLLRYIYCIR